MIARMQPWMIYGANGYTGALIAREAVRRGHRPVLAGRNAAQVEALARELGCEARVFGLDSGGMAATLQNVGLVLHCAGPFVLTSAPMVEACLRAGAHYLDITGEIPVFESIFERHAEAFARGVTLLPGVGFDVVPTDCLAAMLAEHLPGATELVLAFHSKGSALSRGTTRTMIESIHEGGAIRRDGRLVRVPFAYDVRTIPFHCGERTAMTIPWGDVSTAFYTTGIPNIRVYVAASPRAVARAKRLRWLLPLLSPKPMRRLVQKLAAPRGGPDAQKRAHGRVYLWGEVSNGSEAREMTMTTPEGYAFTAVSAVNAAERVLAGARPGAFTPAALLGPEFVSSVPGVLFT
jgi:short subunit dehydrogenase-like uncharacterized protein